MFALGLISRIGGSAPSAPPIVSPLSPEARTALLTVGSPTGPAHRWQAEGVAGLGLGDVVASSWVSGGVALSGSGAVRGRCPAGGIRNLLQRSVFPAAAGFTTRSPGIVAGPPMSLVPSEDSVRFPAGADGDFYAYTKPAFAVSGEVTFSAYVKTSDGQAPVVGFGSSAARDSGANCGFVVNSNVGNLAGAVESVSPNVWRPRVSWYGAPDQPTQGSVGALRYASADESRGLDFAGYQLERAQTPTAYQSVHAVHDVTESGVADVPAVYAPSGLSATLADLGADCTVYVRRHDGVIVHTGQTISGAWSVPASDGVRSDMLREVIVYPRALSAAEDAWVRSQLGDATAVAATETVTVGPAPLPPTVTSPAPEQATVTLSAPLGVADAPTTAVARLYLSGSQVAQTAALPFPITVAATGYGGQALTATIQPTGWQESAQSAPTTISGGAVAEFGAKTYQGYGGWAPEQTGAREIDKITALSDITGATGLTLDATSGTIRFSAAPSAGSCTVTTESGRTLPVQITVIPNGRSVRNIEELTAVLTWTADVAFGDSLLLRTGDYNEEFADKRVKRASGTPFQGTFDANAKNHVIVTPHAGAQARLWRIGLDTQHSQIRFLSLVLCVREQAVGGGGAILAMNNQPTNVIVENCTSYSEAPSDPSKRGSLAAAVNLAQGGAGGGHEVINCDFEGFGYGIAIKGPNCIVTGNRLAHLALDAIQASGDLSGSKISWNRIHGHREAHSDYALTNVAISGGTVTATISSADATALKNLPSDPHVRLSDAGVTATAFIPRASINTAIGEIVLSGSGVWNSGGVLRAVTSHADALQILVGSMINNLEIIGNWIDYSVCDPVDSSGPQGVFIGGTASNHYTASKINGNLFVGLAANAIRADGFQGGEVRFNTAIARPGSSGSTPVVLIGVGTAAAVSTGNRIEHNVSHATTAAAGNTVTGNVAIAAESAAYYATLFNAPPAAGVIAPTIDAYRAKSGGPLDGATVAGAVGPYVDFGARTLTPPA